MYTATDYIVAFSKACAHHITALNDAPAPADRPEYHEGINEAIERMLEDMRDEVENHAESGTFMTSVFNKNVAANVHMFLELLIEQETYEGEEEDIFAQEDGTLDMPADDDEDQDYDDRPPPEEYDFLEYEEGLVEGNARVKHDILPDILGSYEKFLVPQP